VFNESCLGRKAAAGHQAGVGGLTQNLVRLLAGGATLVAGHATDLKTLGVVCAVWSADPLERGLSYASLQNGQAIQAAVAVRSPSLDPTMLVLAYLAVHPSASVFKAAVQAALHTAMMVHAVSLTGRCGKREQLLDWNC